MKKITFVIFIFAFMLLRPYSVQNSGLCYYGDDYSYFAHAASIAFGQYPSYDKEYIPDGVKRPVHSIGPGLMASPFVFAFTFLDRMAGSNIVEQRTIENIPGSWSLFGFVVASSVYFWFACFFLYKAVRLFYREKIAVNVVILLVLFQGIPLYVFRRPVFSHIYEFFLQCLLLCFLVNISKDKIANRSFAGIGLFLGVVTALVALVRLNNIPYSLAWPAAVALAMREKRAFKMLIVSYASFAALFFVFQIISSLQTQSHTYYKNIPSLCKPDSLHFYFIRIAHVVCGIDWGLLFTAPFIIAGILSLFMRKYPFKKEMLLLIIPSFINLFIIIKWMHPGEWEQGSWYGYRYFIFSVIPVLALPMAQLLKSAEEKLGAKIDLIWYLISFVPIISMLCFEGNNNSLTLTLSPNSSWLNNTYQLEVWKTLLTPAAFAQVIFKGGLLYVVYVISIIFGFTERLPAIILEKYPFFSIGVFVKTMILYSVPFILYLSARKFGLAGREERIHEAE